VIQQLLAEHEKRLAEKKKEAEEKQRAAEEKSREGMYGGQTFGGAVPARDE
jgi:hypothetical protein